MNFYRSLIRTGITDETPADRRQEVKLMNGMAFYSILLSASAILVAFILLPQHALIITVACLTEIIAKISVILLNYVQRYSVAKLVFSFITLFVFLLLVAYFGFEANFHYMLLTVFFALFFIFRKGSMEDVSISLAYFAISIISLTWLYLFRQDIHFLTDDEIEVVRLLSFGFNVALITVMATMFYKSIRRSARRDLATLNEASKVANILNTISENLNDGIFKSQPDRGFVFVNLAFAHIYGYADEREIMNTPVENVYYSVSDRESLIDELRVRRIVEGRILHYRRKDGSGFWGRLSCKMIVEDGEDFIVGTVTDVSQQQEQETLLRESERQLREAQRIARLGNWRIENQTKRLYWSAEAQHIHGYSPERLDHAYFEWIDRMEDLSESQVEAVLAKAMMANDEVEFGSWFKTPDGERKYLIYIARYQRSVKVKGGTWYGTVQDRTEQKISESRIIETREFYEALLDQVPIETVIMDEELSFVYISKSAIKDDKLRRWLMGKLNSDYAEYRGLPAEFGERRDEKVRQAFQTNSPVQWQEQMKTRSGEDVYHLRMVFPMEFTQGGKARKLAVGYSFNITEIKGVQIQLEEKNTELTTLNQALDRFVYSISHDLRAPIASVIGLIQLSREAETSDELMHLLDLQDEALNRLDVFIRDVIDYSRNKRLQVKAVPIPVREVLDKCLIDLRFFMKTNNVDLTTDLVPETILTDDMRFHIIVNNLLSNALKYRDPAKPNLRIHVELRETDGWYHMQFSDNGQGIRPEFLEKVWDMFFRGTSESSGSGLGLYILRESVLMMKGTVRVESTLGEGSTFFISFPVPPQDVSSDHPSGD